MAQWSRVCVCVFWGQPITSNASVLMIKGRPLASVISVWRRLKSSLHSLSVSCLDSTAVLSQHTKPPCYIMTAPHRASLAFCQPCVRPCVCVCVRCECICPLIWYLLIYRMLVNRYRGKGDYLFCSYKERLEDIVHYFMFFLHFLLSSSRTKSSGGFLWGIYLFALKLTWCTMMHLEMLWFCGVFTFLKEPNLDKKIRNSVLCFHNILGPKTGLGVILVNFSFFSQTLHLDYFLFN